MDLRTNLPGTPEHSPDLDAPARNPESLYTRSGVIVPDGEIDFGKIADGTSNTILLGETSSAEGRPSPAPGGSFRSIYPWTFGAHYFGRPSNPGKGWLTIDSKIVANPIGWKGDYFANEMPFTSAHPGDGANLAFCDGSVRFYLAETPLNILQSLATRAQEDVVN